MNYIVHAALPVATGNKENNQLIKISEAGAKRICEFANTNNVNRFLHISSGAVYGSMPSNINSFAEDFQWDINEKVNEYTLAKRISEKIIFSYIKNTTDLMIARCFSFIGSHLLLSSGMASVQFVDQAIKNSSITINGTGKSVRSYQYASDMARWLITILVLGLPRQIYNVGSDDAITILELANKISEIENLKNPINIAGNNVSGFAGTVYKPNINKAEVEIGLKNKINLVDGLNRYISWVKQSNLF